MELSGKQLRELLCCDEKAGEPLQYHFYHGIRIVVLRRGWVAVGKLYGRGGDMRLENSSVIRTWGTTKGLGEIASGPTPKTVLDKAGTIRFHENGIVMTIDCDERGWSSLCS